MNQTTLNRRPYLQAAFADASGVLIQSFGLLRQSPKGLRCCAIADCEGKDITRFLAVDSLPPGAVIAFRARVEAILNAGPRAPFNVGEYDPEEPAALPDYDKTAELVVKAIYG